jgi:hypothetical protein
LDTTRARRGDFGGATPAIAAGEAMSTGGESRSLTALESAFLVALARWVERHADTDTIVLPTGPVTGRELLPVLRALGFTRNDRRRSSVRHSLARDGVEVFLSPQQFELFMRVSTAKFGATPAQLFQAIYADDPNGGPIRPCRFNASTSIANSHRLACASNRQDRDSVTACTS